MEVVNKLTQVVNDGLEYVNSNRILSAVLGLFLVLYAALAAPKLPKSVTSWFDNTWFKLGFMFLIAYMATRDPSVAIISAVALLVTLQTLSAQKTAETVVKTVEAKVEGFRERFSEAEMLSEPTMEIPPVAPPAELPGLSEQELAPSFSEAEEVGVPESPVPQPEAVAVSEASAEQGGCGVADALSGYDGSELAVATF